MSDEQIPQRLQEIIEDFQMCVGQEKLMHLLHLSEQLPDLPERLQGQRDEFGQVHECMSPVFIHAELDDGEMQYYFDIPPEAPTVRGYGMILREGLNGRAPEEVLAIPEDFYLEMGLQKVISGQRLNGLGAILRYMKSLAVDKMKETAG